MKQTQRLIMTPQMQQSIQLLQMNSMDLEVMIRDEMLENPFLEMSDDEEGLQAGHEESDSAADLESGASEPETGLSDSARAEAVNEAEDFAMEDRMPSLSGTSSGEDFSDPSANSEGSEDFQTFAENDVDWSEEFADSDTSSYSNANDDSEETDFTTYTGAPESLYDALMRQLTLSALGGQHAEIGKFIVGSINADGYLDCSYESQALMVGYPVELIEPHRAGSEEVVDRRLRRILAKTRKGERPEAFEGMKRKELIARICAELLALGYDQVASMKNRDLLIRLIAKRISRPFDELIEFSAAELVLEVIAHRTKSTSDQVFDVLEVIHDFEPTGVGARDLGECLRLQCEERGIRNRLLYRILDDHLVDLQSKKFREIAKALTVTEQEVSEVFATLSTLDPKPGRSMTKDEVQYISPDVFVKKVDGKYLYYLNEGDAGRLKVAASYRRMMMSKAKAKALAAEGNPSNMTATDLEYASDKYKSAVWLIRNIEKRKSTILRVTEAIMDYQKEFLEKGIEHLRPLTLRDIAERVGMHESTIARVTTKKYVETPRGIFELKYFFSSGLDTDDGDAASSRSIKELLTQMINAEDRRRPLSDQKIADSLRSKGFQIARRTVAKYREQLKILPAKLRKDV
jgi:RNA polymerase sigma-54 factor